MNLATRCDCRSVGRRCELWDGHDGPHSYEMVPEPEAARCPWRMGRPGPQCVLPVGHTISHALETATPEPEVPMQMMRHFDAGATRDSDAGKLDFEGCLSPQVLTEFAKYMDRHRQTADGLRGSDNWQTGIPVDAYMKSLLRHVVDLWMIHRGHTPTRPESGEAVDFDDAVGGAMFNLQGYWLETIKEKAA